MTKDKINEHTSDRELFEKIKKILPYDPIVPVISEHSLGSGIPSLPVDMINKFIYEYKYNPEFSFYESEAQKHLDTLYENSCKYVTFLTSNTTIEHGAYRVYKPYHDLIKDDEERRKSERLFNERIKIYNYEISEDFLMSYKNLIKEIKIYVDKENVQDKNYWNYFNVFWIIWQFIKLCRKYKLNSLFIMGLTFLAIDYSLAWRNTNSFFDWIGDFLLRILE